MVVVGLVSLKWSKEFLSILLDFMFGIRSYPKKLRQKVYIGKVVSKKWKFSIRGFVGFVDLKVKKKKTEKQN